MSTSQYPIANEAELALYGAAIIGGIDVASRALELVPLANLARDDVAEGMTIIAGLVEKGRAVDTLTFAAAWREIHGTRPIPPHLTSAPDNTGSLDPTEYAREINGAARRRQLLYATRKAEAKITDPREDPETVAASLEADITAPIANNLEVLDSRALWEDFIADTERRFNLQGKRSGIATGFRDFDEITDGLQFGELCIIGARPSIGKTGIVCEIIKKACFVDSVPTLFLTFEMAPRAIMRRIAASMFSIPLRELKTGVLTEASFAKFAMFKRAVLESPLHMVNCLSGTNVSRACGIIRRHARTHGVKLVALDYLQKIPAAEKHEKRTYEVAAVSGALKAVAVQTGVAMIAAAQVNRQSENDPDKARPPRLSELADSAQLERDADCIGLLWRNRTEVKGEACIVISKQRDGELGIVSLHFNGEFCRFENRHQ